jgi:hypothetical protein
LRVTAIVCFGRVALILIDRGYQVICAPRIPSRGNSTVPNPARSPPASPAAAPLSPRPRRRMGGLVDTFEVMILIATFFTPVPYMLCSLAELLLGRTDSGRNPNIAPASLAFAFPLWDAAGAGTAARNWGPAQPGSLATWPQAQDSSRPRRARAWRRCRPRACPGTALPRARSRWAAASRRLWRESSRHKASHP